MTFNQGNFSLFFEEPELTRYICIAETLGGLSIPEPENPISDRHFTGIKAPGLIDQSIPILYFRTKHSGMPTYSIRINSTQVIRHTFTDDLEQTLHIFIPPNALKIDENELVINVSPIPENGAVVFSDIAIFYRSNKVNISRKLSLEISPV